MIGPGGHGLEGHTQQIGVDPHDRPPVSVFPRGGTRGHTHFWGLRSVTGTHSGNGRDTVTD
jgi:hypothetical protein